jgi:hypothetical protein
MGVIMQVMYCTYLAGARLDETARIQPVRVVANPALRGTAAQHRSRVNKCNSKLLYKINHINLCCEE